MHPRKRANATLDEKEASADTCSGPVMVLPGRMPV